MPAAPERRSLRSPELPASDAPFGSERRHGHTARLDGTGEKRLEVRVPSRISGPRKCAAYVRVSSKAQNFKTQVESLKRAASLRGERIELWFKEKQSGRNLEREALRELLQRVRAAEIRKLYTFSLDRLTRSGIKDTLEILEILKANACQLQTVADDIDWHGPHADIICAALAYAARLQRLSICENIAAARLRVEAEGGRWGRPRRADAARVRRILELRGKKRSIRVISAALKVPRSTVADVVRRRGAYRKKTA